MSPALLSRRKWLLVSIRLPLSGQSTPIDGPLCAFSCLPLRNVFAGIPQMDTRSTVGSALAFACSEVCSRRTRSSGVARRCANPRDLATFLACRRSGSLSSAGITRRPRSYGPLRHLPRPALALTGSPSTSRLPTVVAGADFPCCAPVLCHACCHPYPGGIGGGGSRSLAPRRRPSPFSWWGGSHIGHFRGLLGVRSRCGPHDPLAPERAVSRGASDHSSPPDPPRVLPAGARVAGWDLHPRNQCTFARHTAERGRAPGLADRRARARGLGPDQGPRARAAAALGLEGRTARGCRRYLNATTVRRRLLWPRCRGHGVRLPPAGRTAWGSYGCGAPHYWGSVQSGASPITSWSAAREPTRPRTRP